MTCFTVCLFFFFCTMNECYIIFSSVFCACIWQQVITVRVCIKMLYVNSTTEQTSWALQFGVVKNRHIYGYRYRLLAKWVVKYRQIGYQQKIQYGASLPTYSHYCYATEKQSLMSHCRRNPQQATSVLLW